MEHNMWTDSTRPKYERAGRRYASDLTDAEWRVIEPYMPAVKRLGRPRETDLRAIVDAILYIARTGCQWRLLPIWRGLNGDLHLSQVLHLLRQAGDLALLPIG